MPQLSWNEADFAACLEVLPVIEEDGISYLYRVIRDGMRLELTVYPYASDIYVDFFREGAEGAVFEMKLIECSGTRYVNDERGECLEFAPAKVFGNRYDGISSIPHGVRLSVKPSISIRLFCQ
jgi:hypothetical protein